MRKKKQVPILPGDQEKIDQYKHKDKFRLNNPQVGMVNTGNDPSFGKKKYSYDPHLDPTLVWTGKKEQSEIEVDTVSIHVHERIDPKTIVHQVHKQNVSSYQFSLFEQSFDHRPVREEVSFYQHKNSWANRLVAGDSLLVMNSLLGKEGMAGQVQMVYMDPPYGITYGSNFQPFVNKRDVKDGKDEDLTTEPEMIKAFRDTWELGIHSYLSYMRDRLLLARELLSETGSCFVQISDENLHYVKALMSEIFGKDNFISLISFRTKIPLRTTHIPGVADYIVWYAKDIKKAKYRRIFTNREIGSGTQFNWVELEDGTRRRMSNEEKSNPTKLPSKSKAFRLTDLVSAGRTESCVFEFEMNGKKFFPSGNKSWKTNPSGIEKLISMRRIMVASNTPAYVFYVDDYPVQEISNLWIDTQGASDKSYVVQTSEKVIQRCMLMCTDPGDLVIDPTCGSGTTAFVAENWGRRWITIDTSRISIQLAKQRLLTTTYDWYKLAHESEGVGAGFIYKTVPHVTLGSITNDEPANDEVLYDKPEVDKGIVRVSGPFTVEAIPAITVKSLESLHESDVVDNSIARTGETARQDDWRSELLKSGVRTKGGDKMEFVRVELLKSTRHLHAEAETTDGKRVLVGFGPDHAPLDQKQVEMALEEAGNIKPAPKLVLFAAFQFDPEAAKDIDETNWGGVDLIKVQMNTDLLTSDLKKSQNSSESFWLVGQPDVAVSKEKDDSYVVTVQGFDYYNPKSGEVQSGGKSEIAMWMLDTDYDGRSIFPTQVFFPMAGAKDGWNKIAKNLRAELDESLLEKFEGTESIPFKSGEYKRCAIKIIDNRGIESLCIKNLD